MSFDRARAIAMSRESARTATRPRAARSWLSAETIADSRLVIVAPSTSVVVALTAAGAALAATATAARRRDARRRRPSAAMWWAMAERSRSAARAGMGEVSRRAPEIGTGARLRDRR